MAFVPVKRKLWVFFMACFGSSSWTSPRFHFIMFLLVLVTGVSVLLELPPNSVVQIALSNCSFAHFGRHP